MNAKLLIRDVNDPILLNTRPRVELRFYSEVKMQGRI